MNVPADSVTDARAAPSRANVSVIVVSWNAKDHLRRCVQSLIDQASDCVREIIVVDNASIDGSPEMIEATFPAVSLIRCTRNLGFSKANNLGFARAKGDCIALINSDVIVHPQCLQRLAGVLDGDPRVGLVGPRIQWSDGRLQLTCRRLPNVWDTWCRLSALDRIFPHVALFSGFELPALRHGVRNDVPALGGCFWLIRRAALEQIGPLDERYFFYAEDMDWCKRCAEGRWRIVFAPQATATHVGGGSSSNAPSRYSVQIIRSTLQYWKKHHGTWGQAVCFVMFVLHHALRLVPRQFRRIVGLGGATARTPKSTEDAVCLRWLLTGREATGAHERART